MLEKITELETALDSLEDIEQKKLYFFNNFCSFDENQRLEFFKLFSANPKNANLLKRLVAEDVLFFIYALPQEQRLEFITTLKSAGFRSWEINIQPEMLGYFLEGISEEHWPDFLAMIFIHFEQKQIEDYFLFRLFKDQQIKIILESTRFTPMYNGKFMKLNEANFTKPEIFSTWRETLISINVLFQDPEKFSSYLKPIDEEIAKSFPSVSESTTSERICNYYFPSAQDYETKKRTSYDRLIDDLFLKKERDNGLSHKDMPYFNGVIPASEIELFVKDYPRTLFKEIISSQQILLHGHNIHRLQWYVIQSAIEQGHIKLPAGATIGDLYDVFMNVGFNEEKIWDTIIDRPRYFSPNSMQNPERLNSYLLTAPDVKQKLPHLNQYMENSFFKKVDRLCAGEQAAESYIELINSSVAEIFFQVFAADNKPKVSFDESVRMATSDNEKRTVSKYCSHANGTGIFFKQSPTKDKEDLRPDEPGNGFAPK